MGWANAKPNPQRSPQLAWHWKMGSAVPMSKDEEEEFGWQNRARNGVSEQCSMLNAHASLFTLSPFNHSPRCDTLEQKTVDANSADQDHFPMESLCQWQSMIPWLCLGRGRSLTDLTSKYDGHLWGHCCQGSWFGRLSSGQIDSIRIGGKEQDEKQAFSHSLVFNQIMDDDGAKKFLAWTFKLRAVKSDDHFLRPPVNVLFQMMTSVTILISHSDRDIFEIVCLPFLRCFGTLNSKPKTTSSHGSSRLTTLTSKLCLSSLLLVWSCLGLELLLGATHHLIYCNTFLLFLTKPWMLGAHPDPYVLRNTKVTIRSKSPSSLHLFSRRQILKRRQKPGEIMAHLALMVA